MKGTFFSADLVKDENDNLRLLEINTDTACITDTLDEQFDFSDWITILQNNNITTVVLIYKLFQSNVVSKIQSVLSTDATFITSVELIQEENNTIYPTAVTDASDKFILRLAYDENALFDSTYAKGRTNVLTLFADNNDTTSVPEFFYEGSEKIYNTYTSSIYSGSNIPDAVRKSINDNPTDPLEFIKFSTDPTFESSSEQILNQFYTSAIDTTINYVEKYHYNPGDLEEDRNISSYRQFGIVYGSNIDYVKLGSYRIESIFGLPDIDFNNEYTFTNGYYYLPKKHYFELTTNALRTHEKIDGIHNTERLLIPNESPKLPTELAVSSSVQSFFISGSPDTDLKNVFTSWSYSGNELPSGSYLTSSIVESLSSESGDYNSAVEINVTSGDSYYVSPSKHFLVYESGSNEWRFKRPTNLTSSLDYFMNQSGSLVQFSSSNFVILEEKSTFYRIDVETTDNFFLSSSESILVHNAPCFVAGTLIDIVGDQGGTKKIENIKVGDEVWTYNHDTNTKELKKVKSVIKKENQKVVRYTAMKKVVDLRDIHYSTDMYLDSEEEAEDRVIIEATYDHPLYVIDKGYCSYSPEQTKTDTGHIVGQIEVGDFLTTSDGTNPKLRVCKIEELDEPTTVYNLNEVEDNHNFFANGVLVHNRAGYPYVYYDITCFSENVVVTLPDGKLKKINEIEVGDVVQGWDGEQISTGSVTAIDHRHTVNGHAEACRTLGDEPSLYTINHTDIEFTPEHPFLTKDGWKSLVPNPNQEPYKTEQEPKVLKLGDEINVNGKWEEVFLIEKIRSIPEEKVYNITVDKLHSYLANGVVVHNK